MKPVSIPADKILECIQLYRDPDKRVRKESIAYYLNLPYTEAVERAIRRNIKKLRDEGYGIVSNSGVAGYYFNPDNTDEIIADLKSRIIEMSATIRSLERGRANREVVQLGLM